MPRWRHHLAVEVDDVEGFDDDLNLDLVGVHVFSPSGGQHLPEERVDIEVSSIGQICIFDN